MKWWNDWNQVIPTMERHIRRYESKLRIETNQTTLENTKSKLSHLHKRLAHFRAARDNNTLLLSDKAVIDYFQIYENKRITPSAEYREVVKSNIITPKLVQFVKDNKNKSRIKIEPTIRVIVKNCTIITIEKITDIDNDITFFDTM